MLDLDIRLAVDLTIRKVRCDDLPKLEWYGQFEHFRRIFRRAYKEQKAGKRLLLIADMNGFPVARLFIQFQGENAILVDGSQRGYLYSLHVLDMFRRQGIGSRLIAVAEQVLRQRHYAIATIAVAKDNDGALRLYQRHGYDIFEENEGRWRYTDHRGNLRRVHEPCYFLAKTL